MRASARIQAIFVAATVMAGEASWLPDASAVGANPEQDGPVIQVDVGNDWVEGFYDPEWPVRIEVRNSTGDLKAQALTETGFPPWFYGSSGFSTRVVDPWVPERPDIVAGDVVSVEFGPPGESVELQVGDIQADVDVDNDTVSGTISAPWLEGPLTGWCDILEQQGANTIWFQVDPDGGSYLCDYGSFWDVTPGDAVLVQYQQPDLHAIQNQFQNQSPQLGTSKTGLGAPTPGGNFEYVIPSWNVGDAPSELVTLSDTLPSGMTYLASTLGIVPAVTDQEVLYDLETLEPEMLGQFSLFVEVSAAVGTDLDNEVAIAAPGTTGVTLNHLVTVQSNTTDLTMVSTPSAPEPLPGSELVWDIEVCNVAATSSADAFVAVTLPSGTPPLGWWGDQAGWADLALTSEEVVVVRPTVPGGFCLGLHVLTHVPADAIPGQELCDHALVESVNDVNADNNEHRTCAVVGDAAPAIDIETSTNGEDADEPPGPILPIGALVEWAYEVVNTGNVPLTGVVVEDDQLGVVPSCPSAVLDPGSSMTCTASGLAAEGQYANLGTATGTPSVGGDVVSASDPSHYFGEGSDVLFSDGFESGDTSAWSSVVQ